MSKARLRSGRLINPGDRGAMRPRHYYDCIGWAAIVRYRKMLDLTRQQVADYCGRSNKLLVRRWEDQAGPGHFLPMPKADFVRLVRMTQSSETWARIQARIAGACGDLDNCPAETLTLFVFSDSEVQRQEQEHFARAWERSRRELAEMMAG